LLPKWRGAAPIQRTLMNLEKYTGISIMKIEEELDSGPICNSYKLNIENNDNLETISDKLSLLAAKKILDVIDDILDDKLQFKEQNHKEATYATKIQKSEGKIDWNSSAENIIGKINGLYPNPGAWFLFRGERYKILKAEIKNGIGFPGLVLDNYLEISCNNNKSIKILEIQRQGKRSQNINEFVLGTQIIKGINLSNA
jgi:methionyl-tRNA formyltransferase